MFENIPKRFTWWHERTHNIGGALEYGSRRVYQVADVKPHSSNSRLQLDSLQEITAVHPIFPVPSELDPHVKWRGMRTRLSKSNSLRRWTATRAIAHIAQQTLVALYTPQTGGLYSWPRAHTTPIY